jgi:hypothetical protein
MPRGTALQIVHAAACMMMCSIYYYRLADIVYYNSSAAAAFFVDHNNNIARGGGRIHAAQPRLAYIIRIELAAGRLEFGRYRQQKHKYTLPINILTRKGSGDHQVKRRKEEKA